MCGQKRRGIEMAQEMLGIREAENGTKASEQLWTITNGHHRIWQNDEKNHQTLEEGRVPVKEAKNWRINGEKEENCQMKKVTL